MNARLRARLLCAFMVLLALRSVPAQGQASNQESRSSSASCGDAQLMAEDRRLGVAMAQDLLTRANPWTGRQVNEYIARLGQHLAQSSGARQPITFVVLYSHELNAQTFPGGIVFINSAAIDAASSEAELAAVLAHEIAHVNNCDWRWHAPKRSAAILLPVAPLVLLAGPVGIAVGVSGAVSARLAQARAHRAMEEQADRLAVEYLARAGYDPRAALTLFDRIEQQGAGLAPGSKGLLATHPSLSARRQKLEILLADLPATPSQLEDSPEFQEARNEILNYDKIYARATGVFFPGSVPPLLHRAENK